MWRGYATAASARHPTFQVFSRHVKQLQRTRAVDDVESSRRVDYLRDEVARRLVDRLLVIKRRFDTVVDLGCGSGHVAKALGGVKEEEAGLVGERVGKLIMADSSAEVLHRESSLAFGRVDVERRVVDEEVFPFDEATLDAVVSNMSMHWINDLPGCLRKIEHALRPDGAFLASMVGGDTLFELRTAMQLAEMERLGGVSPRVSPMTDTRDLGSLMQQAGFKLLTVDVDEIVVDFPDMLALMEDLQAMGESNAVLRREHMLPRDVLLAAKAIYESLHGNKDGASVPATFRILYMIGWKQSEGTARPLPRGSGETSLKDFLGA